MARVFRARPEAALASRLVRGQSPAGVEGLLRRFGQTADERPDDYGAQLAHAELLLVTRRWSEASGRFERAATLSPTALAPRWGRARALREAGKLGESVTELRAALGAARTPQEVERVARELIAAAGAAGDTEAEIDGRRARLGVRVDGTAVLALAAALNQAGRPSEAAAVLQQHDTEVALTATARARWALVEGQYRAAGGDTDGAAVALARAAAEAPLAQTELRREIWERSVEVARRRGALDDLRRRLSTPVDVIEWVARGRVADEQGDLRGAWAALAEAVRRAPRDVELRLREIALARRVGSAAEISALYEQLILVATAPRGPAPAVAVDALDALWQLGRPEVAGRLFDTVLARRAPGAEMLQALGEAASRWGDDRRAERCWTALLRRRPGDEVALVARGELQLQRGQRRSAIDTWRAVLRGSGGGRASRQARFAEILADHELHQQALTEARAAAALSPTEPRHQRLIATILERQSRFAEAENAWETVLRLARGSDRASDRNEARTRLVNLWLRGGSARLEGKLRAMEQALADSGGDRELLMFLVQAQLRTGRGDAAIVLMKATLARVPPGGKGGNVRADDQADAELMSLLVHTLRQAHRTDEAMSWLEELSRRFPARAREAGLQLADMAVVEHADERAQAYAEQAAITAAGDPRVLLRAAGVQERLGHQEAAAAMYRRLLQAGRREPSAALALATLLARTGEVEEQRSLLREVLRGGTEEDVVALAGARAIILEEASGRLDTLEAFVADTPDLNASTPAGRRAAACWRRFLAGVWSPPCIASSDEIPARLRSSRGWPAMGSALWSSW